MYSHLLAASLLVAMLVVVPAKAQRVPDTTVLVGEDNFVFSRLTLREKKGVPGQMTLFGQVRNATNKHWKDLFFYARPFDQNGNDVGDGYGLIALSHIEPVISVL